MTGVLEVDLRTAFRDHLEHAALPAPGQHRSRELGEVVIVCLRVGHFAGEQDATVVGEGLRLQRPQCLWMLDPLSCILHADVRVTGVIVSGERERREGEREEKRREI